MQGSGLCRLSGQRSSPWPACPLHPSCPPQPLRLASPIHIATTTHRQPAAQQRQTQNWLAGPPYHVFLSRLTQRPTPSAMEQPSPEQLLTPPAAARPTPTPTSSPSKLKPKPHPLHKLRLKRKPPSAPLASHIHSSPPLPSPPPPLPPHPLSPASLSTLFAVSSLHEAVALLEEENEGLRHRIEVVDAALIERLEGEVRQLKRERRGEGGGGWGRDGDGGGEGGTGRGGGEVERLEEELLQLRCDKLDLLFVSEEWRAKEARLLRRLSEVERVRDVLSAFSSASSGEGGQGGLVKKEVEGMVRELEALGGVREEVEGEGAGVRLRSLDALGVLRLVKRAVLKLKAEAEEWRRRADARDDAERERERERVQRERRLWEKRLKEAEAEGERSQRGASLRDENQRLLVLIAQLKKDARREREDAQRLRRHLDDARAKAEAREAEVKAQLERRDDQWQQRLDAMGEQLQQERGLIAQMKEQLDSSLHLIHRMQREMEQTQAEKVTAVQVEVQRADGGVEEQRLRAEVERLQRENAAYAAELSAFDEAFFEEIEDLKFRYSQALLTIQHLQRHHQQHEHQHSSATEGGT